MSKEDAVKVSYALLHEVIFAPGPQGGTQHGPRFLSQATPGHKAYDMRLEAVKDQGCLVITIPNSGDVYIPLIQVKAFVLS